MRETYIEMRKRHSIEWSGLPMFYAFGEKQFKDQMSKRGLGSEDTDQLRRVCTDGPFILVKDLPQLDSFVKRHHKERDCAIADDITGTGFIFEMFKCEFENHEYGYTQDAEPVLDALEMTMEQVQNDSRLLCGFLKAKEVVEKNTVDWC